MAVQRYYGKDTWKSAQPRYGCHISIEGINTFANGQTAQEAICIAALKAVGVEIEP